MIIRERRTANFTVINNAVINDDRLSWASLGVLTYLLSKPDDWAVSPQQLINFRSMGKHGIYAVLRELEQFRYARKVRQRAVSGLISGCVWYIYDEPHRQFPDHDQPQLEIQDVVHPHPENRDVAQPHPDSPYLVERHPVNPPLLKTDKELNLSHKADRSIQAIPVPPDLTLDEVSRQKLGMQGITEVDPRLVAEFVAHHEARAGDPSLTSSWLDLAGWQAKLRKWILHESRVYELGRRGLKRPKVPSREAKRDYRKGLPADGRI